MPSFVDAIFFEFTARIDRKKDCAISIELPVSMTFDTRKTRGEALDIMENVCWSSEAKQIMKEMVEKLSTLVDKEEKKEPAKEVLNHLDKSLMEGLAQ